MAKTKFTNLSIKDQNKSKTVKFFTDFKNGVTICRLYDRWDDIYHTAKTRCHDVDAFDEKKGRTIAFNKARRKELMHNLRNIEADRAMVQEKYERIMKMLDAREEINTIYLAGVEDELAELMK